MFSVPGIIPWNGTYTKPADATSKGTFAPAFDPAKNSAFKVYKDTDKDGSNTIFLATKNFTYSGNQDTALPATKTPFGDKGFVIFHKGGDGTFYKKQQATTKTILGYLPGQSDSNAQTDESSDAILPET